MKVETTNCHPGGFSHRKSLLKRSPRVLAPAICLRTGIPARRAEILEGRILLSGYSLSSIPFGANDTGVEPNSSLVADPGGNLFGTTAGGGAYADGTLFEIPSGTGTIQPLVSFNGLNGVDPNGITRDASGNLYGTTSQGGESGYGTVFKVASDSAAIQTLASFDYTNGAYPTGGLLLDSSGNLFGTTPSGGDAADGTVFEIASGTGTIRPLVSFRGTNGANPTGVTLDAGGNLFGATSGGGLSGNGTVFEIARGTGAIHTLASFNGANGSAPTGVTLDGSGNLFGTTSRGGFSDHGTVFEIPSGTGTIQTLASFDYNNGAYPNGGLTLDANGNLHGTTSSGGFSERGTVFQLDHGSGTIQTILFNDSLGSNPKAGLIQDASGNLYGTTSRGGPVWNYGTVFRIASGTGTIQTLASFNVTNGTDVRAGVTVDGSGNIYGMTPQGGLFGRGAVFEIANGTDTIQNLASFDAGNGYGNITGVTLDGSGNLFGTTWGGGPSGDGTVFEIARGSGTIQTLASFNGTNGKRPDNVTLDSSGNLFGRTSLGGDFGWGTVFEIAHGTSTIQTLASLNGGTIGITPDSVTLDSSGNLFGTTSSGGDFGWGTVFEIAHGTRVLQTLASFNVTNGQSPDNVTVDSSGNLYGTTSSGGMYRTTRTDIFGGYGTVFEIPKGTRTIQTLASFDGANGAHPFGGVTLDASGNLFGTTSEGGAYGYGTVFEIAKGTGAIQTLVTFDYTQGAKPLAGVTIDGSGNLYGTTNRGGPSDDGTVFKLSPRLPGDVNGDRTVDLADLLIVAQHYGRPGTSGQGDLDNDGQIAFDDLLILAQHFGHSGVAVSKRTGPGGSPIRPEAQSPHFEQIPHCDRAPELSKVLLNVTTVCFVPLCDIL